jgi:hypothetical protein
VSLLVPWAVFPLLLLGLGLGWGLLVELLLGVSMPRALVPGLGLGAIIVVTYALLEIASVRGLGAPVVAAGALLGLVWAASRRRFWRLPGPAVAAVAAVFCVFAAPVVLSGEATFPGYIKLDDTATWLALTDQIGERGRDFEGLAPSTHEATIAFTLGKGYPVGAFLPLAIGSRLVGQDPAWLIAPYMATLAALLALALWSLSGSLVESPRMRAIAAVLGAQPAILFGYYLWGGTKEVLAATLVATGFGLATAPLAGGGLRRALPSMVAATALGASISVAGIVWLAPALLAVAVGAGTESRPWSRHRAGAAILVAVACALALATASFVSPFRTAFTSATELGNLFTAISPLQLAGVWPAADFRLDPTAPVESTVLIGIVAVTAVIGIGIAVRQRALGIAIYALGVLIVAIATQLVAAPWLAAKAFAIAAPALVLASVATAARLTVARRWLGLALLAVVAGGVLWSNALAYRGVSLAPRDRLTELEVIGHAIAGQGPTLMTEYEPYGVRHFLRDADAEGASELRRRRVPLLSGRVLQKGEMADTDQLRLPALMTYRTLVLRSSPTQSRPPSPYQLAWRGRYYEVWQRPLAVERLVIRHLGLGTEVDPGGVPRCPAVQSLARAAGPAGELAAVHRQIVHETPLERTQHPRVWEVAGQSGKLLPATPGELRARIGVARSGGYEVWLGGSVRPQVDLEIDGHSAGQLREELNNFGGYVRLGAARLDAGTHTVAVHFGGADLHPGSAGTASPIGPLVISSQEASQTRISHFTPNQAQRLCGRRWDWIEAIKR